MDLLQYYSCLNHFLLFLPIRFIIILHTGLSRKYRREACPEVFEDN